MLDYRFIKNNLEAVKQNIINRAMHADAEAAVRLFDERTEMVSALPGLQAKRNENSLAMKKAQNAMRLSKRVRQLKPKSPLQNRH